jgi:hypothetical protein
MSPKEVKKSNTTSKGKERVKRVASPYIIFCVEKRPQVKKAHPEASFSELGKILGQMWTALDDKAKTVKLLYT